MIPKTDTEEMILSAMKERAFAKNATRRDFQKKEAFPLRMDNNNRCPYCESINSSIGETFYDEGVSEVSRAFVCEFCHRTYWVETSIIVSYSVYMKVSK